jgi:hypothetical protein
MQKVSLIDVEIKILANLSILVHFVVGEFDLLEGDDLLPELVAGEGRVGVHVEPGGRRRVCFARHQPRGAVVGVAVTLVVHRNYVQQHRIARVRPQVPAHRHPQGGEHSSAK